MEEIINKFIESDDILPYSQIKLIRKNDKEFHFLFMKYDDEVKLRILVNMINSYKDVFIRHPIFHHYMDGIEDTGKTYLSFLKKCTISMLQLLNNQNIVFPVKDDEIKEKIFVSLMKKNNLRLIKDSVMIDHSKINDMLDKHDLIHYNKSYAGLLLIDRHLLRRQYNEKAVDLYNKYTHELAYQGDCPVGNKFALEVKWIPDIVNGEHVMIVNEGVKHRQHISEKRFDEILALIIKREYPSYFVKRCIYKLPLLIKYQDIRTFYAERH